MKIAYRYFIVISLYTIVSAAVYSETPFSEKTLPAGFFLLPSPVGSSDEMIRIFTAPVIDGILLENKAEEFEKKTRLELYKNYKKVQNLLCKYDDSERKKGIIFYSGQNAREFEIWKEMTAVYDKNIYFWLDSNLTESPYRTLLSDWKGKYKTVSDLRLERQTLIMKSWERFLHLAQKKNFCTMDFKEKNPEPSERLFLPLYSALFRFYEGIPADYRNDLILSMNSRK